MAAAASFRTPNPAHLAAAAGSGSKRHIETVVDIAAEPAIVWAILTDGQAYAEWNPFIVRLEGPFAVGKSISATMKPAGGRAMTFRPRILVADRERELRWRGRLLMPGIFTGEHYFRLEPHAGGTRLIHGEGFSGLLLALLDTRPFRADFEAMNAALKARAEAVQAASPSARA